MSQGPINLGFLAILQENGGYLGGYLVTNVWGRPLEFRLTSAVQPNKVQQVLYAATLVPYICGDLIGKTLVEKAGVPVQLVVTTCEHALDLRLRIETPVVCLLPPNDARSSGELAVRLPHDRGSLVCHPQFAKDLDAVRELVTKAEGMDLSEPFNRIKIAITEARSLGVSASNRAA